MKVVIIGGGPAGSICAVRLIQEAKWAGRDLQVVILEAKPFRQPGPVGCNFCAGVITSRTVEKLKGIGIELPDGVIQKRIEGFYYVTEGGSAELSGPASREIYSVFRGGGPSDIGWKSDTSFDQLILSKATEMGAELRHSLAVEVLRDGRDAMIVKSADGSEERADLLVAAFGVNTSLAERLKIPIGYESPKSIRVCQAELAMDDEMISSVFGNRIFVFSLRHPEIRFLAVTPKRGFVTLTAVGKNVKLPQLREFMLHPSITQYFASAGVEQLEACHCYPRMPVGMARGSVRRRFIAVGDACVCRYYKNGLGSAFFTASVAANAIVHGGVKKWDLASAYTPAVRRRFSMNNRCGKLLFIINDLTYKSRWLAKPTIAYIDHEKGRGRRPMNDVMWSLFVGDRSYCKLFVETLKPLLILRLFWWDLRWFVKRFSRWLKDLISGR